jgi:hypothetical protein
MKQTPFVQLKTACQIKETSVNTEILVFTFNLGPVKVICIANIPEEGKKEAIAYVKLELNPSMLEWGVGKEEG